MRFLQRLQFDSGEQISRKEYLKRKRKSSRLLRKRSKITYVLMASFLALIVYIVIQVGEYRRYNNFKYIAGENVKNQAVYSIFFVTEGYTYDPVYSVSKILSSGQEETSILPSSGFEQISVAQDCIYGLNSGKICKISKDKYKIEDLLDDDVKKYIVENEYIFYTSTNDNILKSYSLADGTKNTFDLSNVNQILADESNVYGITYSSSDKSIYKFNYDGSDKKKLTDNIRVSYAIDTKNNIYFVNKDDSDYIYRISKNGGEANKVADIKSVTNNSEPQEVNGKKYMFIKDKKLYYVNIDDENSLWCYDLETKENNKIISASIEILQNVDDTIFYKINKEMGVYLYNYNTSFMSLVTKRRVKEFVIDTYDTVDYTQVEVDKNAL